MARKLTLKEIDQQIAELQKQADRIRESEKAEVVARIKEAVAYYGLTAADVGLSPVGRKGSKGAKGAAKTQRKAAAARGRVKYKDDAGNTWSGFGRKPGWFVAALASGKSDADLRA